MSIAIISALPQSAPTEAFVGEAASPGGEDFGALLLGLFSPAALISGASESFAGKGEEEESPAGDPLDLLAVLTQASLETRGADTASEEVAREFPAGSVERELEGREALSGNRVLPDTARGALDVLRESVGLAAGRVPTAKFAADAEAGAGQRLAPGEFTAFPLVAANVAASLPAREGAALPLSVSTPVGSDGWRDDFAQKVSWILTQQTQSAELKLNPPALGQIEVSIRLDNERSTAFATFVSGNAEVRESIEAALPRLREMLAGAGIELGQAQVGAESFPHGGMGTGMGGTGGEPSREGGSPSGSELAILAPDRAMTPVPPEISGRGLVDTFV